MMRWWLLPTRCLSGFLAASSLMTDVIRHQWLGVISRHVVVAR